MAIQSLPAPLDALSGTELEVLSAHFEQRQFIAGSEIFREGEPGDSCYIIDEGVVSIELGPRGDEHASDIDNDHVLSYVESGSLLGEMALLDGLPRSASAIAHTDVTARRLSRAAIEALGASHPAVVSRVYGALGRSVSLKLRVINSRLAEAIFSDEVDPDVDETVKRAVAAQKQIEPWPEERIDGLLTALAQAVAGHAQQLAVETVEETKLGDIASKTLKNQLASLGVCRELVGRRGNGLLETDDARQISQIASPMGVIFGLVPLTSPVAIFIFKALIAVKGRNALIVSPSRETTHVARHVDDILRDVLRRHGAPPHLIQCVRGRTSRKKNAQFMSHPQVAMILATGGSGMVKAAYSSGKPAIGVGPGNTPTLVCADADAAAVARAVIASKTFDNGLACGAEHNLVIERAIWEPLLGELVRQGAAVLSPAEAGPFTEKIINAASGFMRPDVIGRPAAEMAALGGIARDYPIRLIVVPTQDTSAANPYAREKMAPILSAFRVDSVEAGFRVCRELLAVDGAGHTAVIHTGQRDVALRFGVEMPAGRVLVNSPAAFGIVGITTRLTPSLTLGCGSFGGNSTTDNVTYTHLLNIKRLAHYSPEMGDALGFKL